MRRSSSGKMYGFLVNHFIDTFYKTILVFHTPALYDVISIIK